MSAVALIKFSQGGNTPAGGRAISGSTGSAITVANDVNTGVLSWEIELVDVPSNSAVSVGVLASNNNNSTPTVNITPDVDGGCYRVVLRVWDAINRVGNPTDVDIRNIIVLDGRGYAIPSSQIYPAPLPPTASGLTGNKPNEFNVGGQERGWAGSGSDGLLDQRLRDRSPSGLVASNTTYTSGNIVFTGSNAVTVKSTTGQKIVIDVPVQTAQTQNVVVPSAGTQTATSGTVIFANSNGITFGMSGSSQITASYTVPSTAGHISAINLSAGTTSNNLTNFVFSNSNNVSFGLNGSTVTASITVPAQTNQSIGIYGISNTTGQSSSSTVDARSLSIQGVGGISVGMSGGSIQLSVPVQSAQTQNIVVPSAGTQTATSGTVVFANSNGISFGMSGSSQITASYTVPSTAGHISAINISGGTTSNNLTALVFSNSNNVSFGLNGSTVTATITVPAQTNQSVGLYGLGNTTQNSSTTLDARSISFNGLGAMTVGYSNGSVQLSVPVQTAQTQSNIQAVYDGANSISTGTIRFSNSNGLSFGINGQTITASHNAITSQTAQTQNIVVPSAGTQTATSGTVVFANSNGLTFGMSGSSQITGSYTVPSTAGLISGINLSAGTTSNNLTNLVFSNSNNVSFGLNGSTVTATVTVPAQTNQTIGLYGLGNTTQNSSTTLDARSLSLNGLGAATVGYSNGSIQISVPTQTVQTQSNIQAIYDGAASISTGTIRFSNSNGITFGINGQTITASHNGLTTQTNQSIGLYGLGNTTQNSSTTLDARSLSFNGLGALTVGYSNGSVQLSAPVQTVQTQGIVVPSAGTQTATSGTVVFGNSNGISFGMSGSSQITASYTVPSTAGLLSGVNLSAGTTSNNLSGFVFSNSNGVSFGLNGSTVTASYTVPSTAGLISAINFSAGTTSNNGTNFVFSNSNNVSFGLNGSTVTATITVPAQTNQSIGFYAVGNTTVESSSSTFDARSVSIQGAGIASVGYSNGSVIISVPTGAPSPVNFSAGTTSGNLGSVVFSNSNGVSFGLNGSVITASASGGGVTTAGFYALGNTTQNSSTTLALSAISFNALGAATMGYSNNSIQMSVPSASSISGVGGISIATNGSTISISGWGMTNFEPVPLAGTTSYAPGVGSWYFDPFLLPGNLSGGRLNRVFSFDSGASVLAATSSASFSNNTTGSRSVSLSYANSVALYQLVAGTNSTQLSSLWSNSFSVGLAHSVSIGSGAGGLSVSNAATVSYVASINSLGAYTTASLSGSTLVTTTGSSMNRTAVTVGISSIINMLQGALIVPIGFNTTIAPGEYWLAQAFTTASTTAGTSASCWSQLNHIVISANSQATARLWGRTASTQNSLVYPGIGVYSAASASPPSTLAFSQINTAAVQVRQYFNFVNSTI